MAKQMKVRGEAKQTKVRGEAKLRKQRSKRTVNALSQRTRTSKTVRLDDLRGLETKFNKTRLESEVHRELFYFCVKCYEQVVRGKPPGSVATSSKKEQFYKFRRFTQPEFLKPLPEGFEILPNEQKVGALQKLIEDFMNAVFPMVNQDVSMMQRNYPDGEGTAAIILNQGSYPDQIQGYEGTAPAVIANQDVDMMQGNYPDNMRNDEGTAAVFVNQDIDIMQGNCDESTPSSVADPIAEGMANMSYLLEASTQNVARHQLDKPQGRPPPSLDYLHQCPGELSQGIGKLKRWAFGHPDILWTIQRLELEMMSCVKDLYDRDLLQALGADSRNPHLRSREKEIYAQLQEDITIPDPQYQLSMPLTEDVSSGVSCYHKSDFVVDAQYGLKNSAPAIPQGKQDHVILNQAISEVLEEVPRHPGHLKLDRADIHPQVCGSSFIGSLEHQPPKQYIDPQGSRPQVYDPGDMQAGGEKFITLSYVGLNNTLPIVGMDYSLSTEPPGVGQATWLAEMQNQFHTP